MTNLQVLRRELQKLHPPTTHRLILVGTKGYLPKDHRPNDRYILLDGLKGDDETVIWDGSIRTVISTETEAGGIL